MSEIERDALINDLVKALVFYGDPESYHAIMIIPDRPAGGFADDFSEDHGHPYYDRPMHGAKARAVLKKHFDELMPALERHEAREEASDDPA